jgi:hypothetical protein
MVKDRVVVESALQQGRETSEGRDLADTAMTRMKRSHGLGECSKNGIQAIPRIEIQPLEK